MTDRWLSIAEVAAMLGLSERSVLELERCGLPLRRVSPKGNPGALESELLVWLKSRPRRGKRIRKHVPA